MKTALANFINKMLGTWSLQLLRRIDVFGLQQTVLARISPRVPGGAGSPVIFDLGASDGERTTRKYRKLFPDAVIHSFEPDEERFLSLQRKRLSNVTSHNLAVSDEDGETTFYCNDDADTNSLLQSNVLGSSIDRFTKFKREIRVKTTTLETFCKEHNISNISILKMDIQGAELRALHGALNLLKAKKIALIYLEVEFARIYKDQPLYHDLAAFLESVGYELYGIYNLCSIEQGRLAWADAIFVPTSTSDSK
jgi:FkbM family methyltransferase